MTNTPFFMLRYTSRMWRMGGASAARSRPLWAAGGLGVGVRANLQGAELQGVQSPMEVAGPLKGSGVVVSGVHVAAVPEKGAGTAAESDADLVYEQLRLLADLTLADEPQAPPEDRAVNAAADESTEPQAPESGIVLRPYQEECITTCLESLEEGVRRVVVQLATGGGKTVIFSRLIERVRPINGHGNKTLVLVHRRELAEQAARHCAWALPSKRIEVDMGDLHADPATADVVVALVQLITRRLDKYNPNDFKLIVVDECHHAAAVTYRRVFHHFGDTQHSVALVGFSATPRRNDKQGFDGIFDEVVFERQLKDLVGDGWLVNGDFKVVRSAGFDTKRLRMSKKTLDFMENSLDALDDDDNNAKIVNVYLGMYEKYQMKSTLVFCLSMGHVYNLYSYFRSAGVDVGYVTSQSNLQERDHTIQRFRDGELKVMLNCAVFMEGTDIPNIDSVFVVRPTRNLSLFKQMVGRGLRLHPGKELCLVVDFVGHKDISNVEDIGISGGQFEEVFKAAAESVGGEPMPEEPTEQMLEPIKKEVEAFDMSRVEVVDMGTITDFMTPRSEKKPARHPAWDRWCHWIRSETNEYAITTSSKGGVFLKVKEEARLHREGEVTIPGLYTVRVFKKGSYDDDINDMTTEGVMKLVNHDVLVEMIEEGRCNADGQPIWGEQFGKYDLVKLQKGRTYATWEEAFEAAEQFLPYRKDLSRSWGLWGLLCSGKQAQYIAVLMARLGYGNEVPLNVIQLKLKRREASEIISMTLGVSNTRLLWLRNRAVNQWM